MFKTKVYIYSKPQGQTLVSDWWFSSQRFPRAIHQPFYQTQSCVSQVASFTPEKNSGKSSHSASTELPHFPFHRFFYVSSHPVRTTTEISNPLNFLLLQTRTNCIGRSWNLSTKRPDRRLHSGPPYLLHSIIWRLSRRETTSHLCFHSEASLYPQPSLRMPDWGLLQKKMARKNTYNAINLPDLRSCIVSKQRASCTSRDNLDRAHSILIRRIFYNISMYGGIKWLGLIISKNVVKKKNSTRLGFKGLSILREGWLD